MKNEVVTLLLYFISQIETLDIWAYSGWTLLAEAKKDIAQLKTKLLGNTEDFSKIKEIVIVLWHQLTNLGTMYEDLCRERFLPKMIGLMTSYPTSPEVIKNDK